MLEADIVEKKKYKERGKLRIYTQGSVLTEKYKDGYQGMVRDWKTKVKFKGETWEKQGDKRIKHKKAELMRSSAKFL